MPLSEDLREDKKAGERRKLSYELVRGKVNRAISVRYRAANNFPVGTGQIVRSNLFLLGHIPFFPLSHGRTNIDNNNIEPLNI